MVASTYNFHLTPNSRSVFRAGVSLNIHSFIHTISIYFHFSFSHLIMVASIYNFHLFFSFSSLVMVPSIYNFHLFSF